MRLAELAQRLDVVHLLPDQVRRVVVQPEVRAGDLVEHPPPDRRAWARFLPPGHSSRVNSIGQFSMPIRTPCVLGELDQRRPDFQEPRPVVVDRSRPVAADERVDGVTPSSCAARITFCMCST